MAQQVYPKYRLIRRLGWPQRLSVEMRENFSLLVTDG